MRKRVTVKCFAIVIGIAVGGCSPDRARYTLDEYRADANLRHSQMERCKADPGTLEKTPDCINARQAAVQEDRVRLRDVPPIGLGEKSPNKPDTDLKGAESTGESAAPAR
jgi:hypothetical protein